MGAARARGSLSRPYCTRARGRCLWGAVADLRPTPLARRRPINLDARPFPFQAQHTAHPHTRHTPHTPCSRMHQHRFTSHVFPSRSTLSRACPRYQLVAACGIRWALHGARAQVSSTANEAIDETQISPSSHTTMPCRAETPRQTTGHPCRRVPAAIHVSRSIRSGPLEERVTSCRACPRRSG